MKIHILFVRHVTPLRSCRRSVAVGAARALRQSGVKGDCEYMTHSDADIPGCTRVVRSIRTVSGTLSSPIVVPSQRVWGSCRSVAVGAAAVGLCVDNGQSERLAWIIPLRPYHHIGPQACAEPGRLDRSELAGYIYNVNLFAQLHTNPKNDSHNLENHIV